MIGEIITIGDELTSGRTLNTTSNYAAAHTGTKMFSVNMTISIPSSLHLGDLREQFTEFCDSLNLDAFMEPAKH